METNRCAWCTSHQLLQHYHDTEWGVAVHNDALHFEYLLMEAMSCGLSWLLMLKKRHIFCQCFAGFDAPKVAAFNAVDAERILQTEGMIRSRRKIEAVINNARCFLAVQQEFGSFDRYLWAFSGGKMLVYPAHRQTRVVKNALSDAIAKDLRRRGFKYLGSVTIFSYLQSMGMINDHDECCPRYREVMTPDADMQIADATLAQTKCHG